MRAALTIARRDLRAAFESPSTYVLIAAFLAVSGLFFTKFLLSFSDFTEQLRMAAAAASDPAMAQRLSLDRAVVAPTLGWIQMMLMVLVPLLTMRALAEERKQGTMELLLTAPVHASSIILGKYLGALGIAWAAVALSFGLPLTLVAVAAPDVGPLVTGYLGLFLTAAVLTALGILASSLTDSSLIAAFLGFAFTVSLVLAGVIGNGMVANAGLVLSWLSPLVHFDAFAVGVVDTADIAYFVIVSAAALFLALRVMDSHRWR